MIAGRNGQIGQIPLYRANTRVRAYVSHRVSPGEVPKLIAGAHARDTHYTGKWFDLSDLSALSARVLHSRGIARVRGN
jgi:hypothetical protein